MASDLDGAARYNWSMCVDEFEDGRTLVSSGCITFGLVQPWELLVYVPSGESRPVLSHESILSGQVVQGVYSQVGSVVCRALRVVQGVRRRVEGSSQVRFAVFLAG